MKALRKQGFLLISPCIVDLLSIRLQIFSFCLLKLPVLEKRQEKQSMRNSHVRVYPKQKRVFRGLDFKGFNA
jgi:hypothetical protein